MKVLSFFSNENYFVGHSRGPCGPHVARGSQFEHHCFKHLAKQIRVQWYWNQLCLPQCCMLSKCTKTLIFFLVLFLRFCFAIASLCGLATWKWHVFHEILQTYKCTKNIFWLSQLFVFTVYTLHISKWKIFVRGVCGHSTVQSI